jgi:hypothetical protein
MKEILNDPSGRFSVAVDFVDGERNEFSVISDPVSSFKTRFVNSLSTALSPITS